MRIFIPAAVLLIAALPGAARAQQPDTMRDVGFGEFTTNSFLHDLPVAFRIPAGYVAVSPEGQATRTYWMSRTDSAAQAANPEHTMRDGFYSVALSLNVGYDPGKDRFFSEAGDETTMKADFERGGFTGVSLERHLVNGFPVLFVEAENNGRRGMLAYIASLVDTNVVYAFYVHPESFREVDQARWDAFKAAILASPPPATAAR